MLDYKPAETPIAAHHGLQMIQREKLDDKDRYRRMVGKLIYLSHTRPDIAYAVGVVSRFMHMPQIDHMTSVMRILRYLKGKSSKDVLFGKNNNLDLLAYTDAN